MEEVARLLNELRAAGVITDYALFGATAQMRYTEPVATLEGVPLRVVDADHLALIALDTGRAKDFARILALLDSRSVTVESIARLADQHGLSGKWQQFQSRFLHG